MDTARMLRRVTQPPHIAGPLYLSQNGLPFRYLAFNDLNITHQVRSIYQTYKI